MKKLGAIALGIGILLAIALYVGKLVAPDPLPSCEQRMWALDIRDPNYDRDAAAVIADCHNKGPMR